MLSLIVLAAALQGGQPCAPDVDTRYDATALEQVFDAAHADFDARYRDLGLVGSAPLLRPEATRATGAKARPTRAEAAEPAQAGAPVGVTPR